MTIWTAHPEYGGRLDVRCTECRWAVPTGWHEDVGEPGEHEFMDLVDDRMPKIFDHIDQTGHTVRSTVWTFTEQIERSSFLHRSRATGGQPPT
jgi:hypothetical protein